MLKILLIEDNQEKKRVVVNASLATPGISIDSFEFATDVFSAKAAISRTRFDLVILDINLPARADAASEVGRGLDILRFIKVGRKAKAPAYLFGLTAYDDGAEAAAEEFSSPLWKLLRFSFSDFSWQSPLNEALLFLIKSKSPPYHNDGINYHVDLAIFTALEEELASILSLDAEWVNIAVPHDHSTYYKGVFKSENGSLSVVVTVAPTMGMPSAGVSSSKLIHNFRPKYLAITGICAGVRGKSNIGDILIADPCFDWGSGKWVRDAASGDLKFKPASYQWRLDESLRSAARFLASPDLMRSIHQDYNEAKPDRLPQVIVDAMASGASVLQAASLMEDVREQHKNLVGVEMESYAVFTAAQLAADPRPKCISIKSVCDFGDETKADSYHRYASYTSARYLFEFATKYLTELIY